MELPITANAEDYKALDDKQIRNMTLQEVRASLHPGFKWTDETKAKLNEQVTRKLDEMMED